MWDWKGGVEIINSSNNKENYIDPSNADKNLEIDYQFNQGDENNWVNYIKVGLHPINANGNNEDIYSETFDTSVSKQDTYPIKFYFCENKDDLEEQSDLEVITETKNIEPNQKYLVTVYYSDTDSKDEDEWIAQENFDENIIYEDEGINQMYVTTERTMPTIETNVDDVSAQVNKTLKLEMDWYNVSFNDELSYSLTLNEKIMPERTFSVSDLENLSETYGDNYENIELTISVSPSNDYDNYYNVEIYFEYKHKDDLEKLKNIYIDVGLKMDDSSFIGWEDDNYWLSNSDDVVGFGKLESSDYWPNG